MSVPHPEIRRILEEHVPTGLYAGEDPTQFPEFIRSMEERLKSADSPRNQVIREMLADWRLPEELARIGIVDWHGNPPYLFEQVSAHPEFQAQIRQERFYRDSLEKYRDIANPESDRHKRICAQLEKSDKTIDDILVSMKSKLDRIVAEKDALCADPRYQVYLDVCAYVRQYQDKWDGCNLEIGEESQDKGAKLESRLDEIIAHVSARDPQIAALTPSAVYTNVYWRSASGELLGEVDIVLRFGMSNYILIECKARTHDVMAGWLQNGPLRSPEKSHLELDGTLTAIPFDSPTYVVTVIPDHDFLLPVESLVKRVMRHKIRSRKPIEEIYEYATELFVNRITPLEWYVRFGHQWVIVL